MVLIEAILTGLATAGFINLIAKDKGSNTIISGTDSQGNPVSITVPSSTFASELPIISARTNFKRVSGITATTKQGAPNIKLVNNTVNNRLFHISIIPDATMKTEGALVIEINGSTLLTIDASALTDTDALSIPIPNEGILLNQASSIDFFVYNPTGNAVALTALVLTGVKQSLV